MIKYGEQRRQHQINTNIRVFREQLTANIKNKFTLWPLRLIHLPKQSATFLDASKTVLKKVLQVV